MPYRDPAQRAAWMRQYRKRKRAGQVGAPAAVSSSPSVVRAPEPSRTTWPISERTGPQPMSPNAGFVESLLAAASRAHWNWRGLFLRGSSPHGYARTATAPDTVHPAHGAAIVEVQRDESASSPILLSGPPNTSFLHSSGSGGRPSGPHCDLRWACTGKLVFCRG